MSGDCAHDFQLNGFVVVKMSKTLMQVAAGDDALGLRAATALGQMIAKSARDSTHQPCTVVRIDIVETT